ncbi:hypothetical protein MRX96_016245 [Rhipicephalus microplus]
MRACVRGWFHSVLVRPWFLRRNDERERETNGRRGFFPGGQRFAPFRSADARQAAQRRAIDWKCCSVSRRLLPLMPPQQPAWPISGARIYTPHPTHLPPPYRTLLATSSAIDIERRSRVFLRRGLALSLLLPSW